MVFLGLFADESAVQDAGHSDAIRDLRQEEVRGCPSVPTALGRDFL